MNYEGWSELSLVAYTISTIISCNGLFLLCDKRQIYEIRRTSSQLQDGGQISMTSRPLESGSGGKGLKQHKFR